MKSNIYYAILIFSLVLVTTSCQKETSEDGRIRIKQIADNIGMENPLYVFEYNSDNLLSRIIEEYMSSQWIYEIGYNSSNKPITINKKSYYNGSLENESTKNVGWNSDGFEIYGSGDEYKKVYSLNSNNNIETIISLSKDYLSQEFDTSSVEYYMWTGKNEVNILIDYDSPWSISNAHYGDIYKFNDKNSPFKDIDLSILFAAGIELAEWGEIQNKYCTSENTQGSSIASISYEFNEQNFPIKADIIYSEDAYFHDYIYFEYESY